MNSLGSTLFSELSPKFFGILVSVNARVYLDVIDALEREMPARGDSLDRTEALEIIDRVLSLGLTYAEEDEEVDDADVGHPASMILRRLIAAKWLEEERRSDYRRTIYVEAAAQAMLEAFRTMVSQSVASFTGKLRLVCDRLAELRYPHSRLELIWEELKNCLAQTRAGLRELRLIRKQVERFAQRQLKTATLAEALDIIYNEFSQLITQQCYRELIHARLPARLREAMEGLNELERDDLALQKLREDYIRTQPETERASIEILRTIEDLSIALGDVEPSADRVDEGTADFARRSRSRIRYIQDVGSARRQQVKVIFDYVKDHLAGTRLTDLENRLTLPSARLVDDGLVGMSSLARTRQSPDPALRRPVVLPLTDEDREESLREMERNLRNALRLDRANRFVDGLELESGQAMSSEAIPVRTEDDVLDIISCLVFATAGGANYRLETERSRNPSAAVLLDKKAGFNIERFELERK